MKPQSFITRKAIVDIIAALLILLFTYTAVSKLMTWDLFRFLLGQAPGIGKQAGWLFIAIPAVELIIAALLFFPSTRLKGLYASLALMLLFTMYVIYMVQHGGNLPCSCGGVISQMTWTQHIYFNIFFTLAALAGIILQRKEGTDPSPGKHSVMIQGAGPQS